MFSATLNTSGNQTITMIVRAMALDQVGPSQVRRLWRKELGVSLFNGLVWGTVIGVLIVAVLANASVPASVTEPAVAPEMIAGSLVP